MNSDQHYAEYKEDGEEGKVQLVVGRRSESIKMRENPRENGLCCVPWL